jgi:hypothetical protein
MNAHKAMHSPQWRMARAVLCHGLPNSDLEAGIHGSKDEGKPAVFMTTSRRSARADLAVLLEGKVLEKQKITRNRKTKREYDAIRDAKENGGEDCKAANEDQDEPPTQRQRTNNNNNGASLLPPAWAQAPVLPVAGQAQWYTPV